MPRFPGAIQEIGPYPQGSFRPVGAVCHRTYGNLPGDLAVARGSRPGIGFHFLVAPDGRCWQFYDTHTKANHAKGANSDTVGIEVTSLSNRDPFTPGQMATLGRLVRWLAETEGIPLRHIVPPRTENHRGFIDHAAVAGSDHADLWRSTEWDTIVNAAPAPPEEVPDMADQVIPNYTDGAIHYFFVADGGDLYHSWWPRKEPYGRHDEHLARDIHDFDGQPSVIVDKETDNKIHVLCDRKGSNPPVHAFYLPAGGWGYD